MDRKTLSISSFIHSLWTKTGKLLIRVQISVIYKHLNYCWKNVNEKTYYTKKNVLLVDFHSPKIQKNMTFFYSKSIEK